MRARYLALLTAAALATGGTAAMAASSTSAVKVTAHTPQCSVDGGPTTACKSTYAVATGHTLTISSPAVTTTPTPPSTPTPPPPTTGVDITAYTTGYGWPDNTPPGGAISNPVLHQTAGGTGTYSDPITLAVGHSITNGVDTLDYPAGTIFYIPNVRRYFIVEDTCGDGPTPQNGPCNTGYPAGTTAWVDMWVGGQGASTSAVLNCESFLTDTNGVAHLIIENPASDYVVVAGSLFQNGQCTQEYGNTPVTAP